MPESRDPFLPASAYVNSATSKLTAFNELDVQDLARYGKSTPPLAGFIDSMKKDPAQRGFRILRRKPDDLDLLIENGDGDTKPLEDFQVDRIFALVKWGLLCFDDEGVLQLVENPPNHRVNAGIARRVPEESRPGLRVDFIPGTNDNDF